MTSPHVPPDCARARVLVALLAAAAGCSGAAAPSGVRHFGDTPIAGPAPPTSLDGGAWTAANVGLGIVGMPATVPGDIISDLQRAGLHNPPFEANSVLFETEWLNTSARVAVGETVILLTPPFHPY